MRRLIWMTGLILLAGTARIESWVWTPTQVHGAPDAGANPVFMTYDPGLSKVLLTVDSGTGQVASYVLNPPRWDPLGECDMKVVGPGPGYAYLKTQGLVFDRVRNAPLLFGIEQGPAPDELRLMMPFLAGADGQWRWAADYWRQLSPKDTGTFLAAYDELRGRSTLMGMLFQPETSTWTHEFDGYEFSHLENPKDWNFSSGVAGFDPEAGRIIFFGKVRTNHAAETAEFDGTSWTLRTPTLTPRKDSLMTPLAYVPELHSLVGVENLPGGAVTWRYADGEWEVLPAGDALPARPGAQLVWDEARGRLVFFGGIDTYGDFSGEVWELVKVPGHLRPLEKP